jgi:hypothetical protein
VFIAQAASQNYIGRIAGASRSTAASLYLVTYYGGGGLGAILPVWTWTHFGWPPTVGIIVGVQIVAAILAFVGWQGPAGGTRRSAPMAPAVAA